MMLHKGFAEGQVIGPCSECKWWSRERRPWVEFPEVCKRPMADGAKFWPAGYEVEGVEAAPDYGCVQWEAMAKQEGAA